MGDFNNYYREQRSAILVIDMLNAFFKPDSILASRRDKLVTNINEILSYATEKDIPIINIRQEYKQDLSDAPLSNKKQSVAPLTIYGEEGSKTLDDLKLGDNFIEIVKKRHSAFFETDLEMILREFGVNTLVITGINSMTCVRASVVDAYQRDYEVILALDCIDGYDEVQHKTSIQYMQYSLSTGLKNDSILEVLRNDVARRDR